jgi:hypothetical protein
LENGRAIIGPVKVAFQKLMEGKTSLTGPEIISSERQL